MATPIFSGHNTIIMSSLLQKRLLAPALVCAVHASFLGSIPCFADETAANTIATADWQSELKAPKENDPEPQLLGLMPSAQVSSATEVQKQSPALKQVSATAPKSKQEPQTKPKYFNADKSIIAAGPMDRPPPATMPNILPAKPTRSPSAARSPSSPASSPAASSAPDSAYNSGTIEYEEHVPDTSKFPRLNVLDALNGALIESPRAAAIRSQFGITQAGYAQVTQVPNPFFFFDRGMVAEQENRIGPLLSPEPPWKLIFRFIVQKNTVDQARYDLLAQLWQLRADVRRAYTEVVVAQETLKALDELYELSSKLETVVRKRFQAGAVPELDVMKTHLALSQTGVDRIVGVQRVIKARQGLNVILGRPVDTPFNVPELPDYTGGNAPKFELHAEKNDMLPDFSKNVDPLAKYLAIAEGSRLELKSLLQQQKLNAANLQLAYGNMIPNPSVAFGKSEAGNVPTGPKVTALFFTINVAPPSTNTNQGNIATFKATAKQLRYQILSQKNQISSDVSSAYQGMIASRDKLRTYQEHILSDSYQVARLARRSYEVGQSDITATLAAQQVNVQTRSAYLDAVTTYENSFTDLEQACGMPLQ